MKNQRARAAVTQDADVHDADPEAALADPQDPRESELRARPPEESSRAHWSRLLGLHPLVAFGMIAVDMMLFGGEAASGGIGLLVTIPVALALTIPCVLLQRYAFDDTWGAALGKGLMVGVLTAIPMPIGSPVTVIGGILGIRGMIKPKPKELGPRIKTRVLPETKR